MYETLIMLKQGEEFSPQEMHELVKDVCDTGEASFGAVDSSCVIRDDESYIQIDYAASPDVATESKEIAEFANMDCAECTVRFEMNGQDIDMLLFNDYLLVLEKISATNKFYIFDSAQGEEYVA